MLRNVILMIVQDKALLANMISLMDQISDHAPSEQISRIAVDATTRLMKLLSGDRREYAVEFFTGAIQCKRTLTNSSRTWK